MYDKLQLAVFATYDQQLKMLLEGCGSRRPKNLWFQPVFRSRIRIRRICMFLGLLDQDQDPYLFCPDTDLDPYINKQNFFIKTLISAVQ
jgi:hypothetical protein